jgi:peptide/nickel transport system permease protein
VLAFLVGISMGFTAALAGAKTDMVISRIYDAFLSMPTIMLGLVVIAALGSSIPVLVVTAGLIYSCGLYRIARALAIEIKVMDFVEAARARGERLPWIIRSEILPNAVIPLVSEFGLRLVFSILFISGLSFLGLGVQPPTADWGVMVRENLAGLAYGSAAAFVPAAAIASLTIGINLIVDDFSAQRGQEIAGEMI